MANASNRRSRSRKIIGVVLKRHPKSHADQLRIDVSRNTPAPLFQWLIASLLFSARISGDLAQDAARVLFDKGWRTPQRMADTTWRERVTVLNRSGYARYDESTSRYIGETTALVLDVYGGDLRRLRSRAGGDTDCIRKFIKEFKGLGEIGADIFCREVQVPWGELYPFADSRALSVAADLGLSHSARGLARLVDRRRDFPRVLAGLAFIGSRHEVGDVLEEVD